MAVKWVFCWAETVVEWKDAWMAALMAVWTDKMWVAWTVASKVD